MIKEKDKDFFNDLLLSSISLGKLFGYFIGSLKALGFAKNFIKVISI